MIWQTYFFCKSSKVLLEEWIWGRTPVASLTPDHASDPNSMPLGCPLSHRSHHTNHAATLKALVTDVDWIALVMTALPTARVYSAACNAMGIIAHSTVLPTDVHIAAMV
jgi:hypothetical protein